MNLVTFEQAKSLKELGFNKWTFYLFDKYDKTEHRAYDSIIQLNRSERYLKRPSVSEALEWIREEKEIACSVEINTSSKQYYGVQILDTEYNGGKIRVTGIVNKYMEAESALLTKIIKYLK